MRGKKPDPASLTGQARQFFEDEPEAELTPTDLGKRLGLTKLQTYTVVRNLRKQGICESVRVIRLKRAA
jgi:hypothetical protein